MPSKQPVSTDLFSDSKDDNGHSEWVAKCRQAQYNLEQVKNPYVGNKRKLLTDMGSVLFKEGLHEVIPNGKVLDLFAGSGFVSYFFKYLGAAVWANDILASSYLNAASLIESNVSILEDKIFNSRFGPITYRDMMEKFLNKDVENIDTLISDKYVPDRFSAEEGQQLDRIMKSMQDWTGYPAQLSFRHTASPLTLWPFGKPQSLKHGVHKPFTHDKIIICSFMHYILNKCFVGGRLNSGQILAKYDHRIDHIRNGGNEMTFRAIDMPIYDIAIEGNTLSAATRSDALSLLTSNHDKKKKLLESLDLVYIDPPYGGEQSDYSAMYEFLEFFLLGRQMEEEKEDLKRFVKARTYKENFNELLDALPKQASWIFSYNDSSWADIEEITDCIKNFRKKVSVNEIDYKYHYRKDQSAGVEYVIVVRPE